MNLKEWAVANGVHPVTAYRWFREGKLPVSATKVGGLILVDLCVSTASTSVTVVYAAVSSADQRQDLERQVSRVTTWVTRRNLPVARVVAEVGSPLNGRRRKLAGSCCATRMSRRSSLSTETDLRGSVPSTCRQHCQRRVVGCWSWTLPRLTTTWCGT